MKTDILLANGRPCRDEIINFGKQSIAFLSMVTMDEGIVIGYSHDAAYQDQFLTLTCHHFRYIDGIWQAHTLFSFCIPTILIFDETCSLCEAIRPFLPYITPDGLFFSSAERNNFVELLHCNTQFRSIRACSDWCFFPCPDFFTTNTLPSFSQHIFAPLMVGKKFMCGYSF